MLLIKIFVELRVVAGRSRMQAGSPQAVSRRPCCVVALRRTAWSENCMGMVSMNGTRPHCVNQMGKAHSKPVAARHGRRTAWARHAMCESAFSFIMCVCVCVCVCLSVWLSVRLSAWNSSSPTRRVFMILGI
jgi:hypothetical protein